MAIVRVQGNFKLTADAIIAPATLNLGAPPTIGNLLILTYSMQMGAGGADYVNSVVQAGVVWAEAIRRQTALMGGGNRATTGIWYGYVTGVAGVGITIGVVEYDSSPPTFMDVNLQANVCEWSGLITSGVLDQTASREDLGFGTAAVRTGLTAMTNQVNELCIGCGTGSGTQNTPTFGFTLLDGVTSPAGCSNSYLYKIVSALGTYETGDTDTAPGWGVCGSIATFKEAPPPPTVISKKTSEQEETPLYNFSARIRSLRHLHV